MPVTRLSWKAGTVMMFMSLRKKVDGPVKKVPARENPVKRMVTGVIMAVIVEVIMVVREVIMVVRVIIVLDTTVVNVVMTGRSVEGCIWRDTKVRSGWRNLMRELMLLVRQL